ncbi:MAG TPA: type II toxin-antitoxin system RelE/ParE family toxin [Streptosporangiales bacterium]
MADEGNTIDLSKDVADWYKNLGSKDKARADKMFDRLKEHGSQLGMPHSRSLGGGLRELRLKMREGTVDTRVTYHQRGTEFRTLTVFNKTKMNERQAVNTARDRMMKDIAGLEARATLETKTRDARNGTSGKRRDQDRADQRSDRERRGHRTSKTRERHRGR